jgi:hypothetical protein
MTTKEMNPQERIQAAMTFLRQSDEEFAAGDHLQASEKLYGAAVQVVTAIAQQRNWRYDSHRAMKNNVYRLGREYGDNFIVGGFAAAEKFHWNFYHDSLEPYEIEGERPIVHDFVARLAVLADAEG